jgi:hypothetical protein
MTPSGCQNFPPSAAVLSDHRRPSDHPTVLQECLADLHERPAIVREGPAPSPRGPRRLSLGPRPFSRGPSRRRSRAPRRPRTSSSSVAALLPYKDDVLLPAGRFPNRRRGTATDSAAASSADSSATPARHRRLISSPLATHGGRGWGRRRRDDRPDSIVFFKMQLHVYNFYMDHGLWINRFKNVKNGLCIVYK